MKIKKIWKKAAGFFCAALCLIQIRPVGIQAADYWPEEPEIISPCAIVMEASTGAILYEKNSKEAHYPASITKIMTTMLALENSSLDEMVTFSDDSINKTEGSGICRDYGEQMTMEHCLYAIMLESANECAYAVAEHVAGSIEAFADMMNEKAKELGCVNTHFVNPHGLHDENHYTCCYDMALIAKAAYQNETFRIITATKSYMIPPTNKHEEETPLNNHNKMLHRYHSGNYVYEYCTGGKTGYTSVANSTLVEFAEKDGMTLISVVMNTDGTSEWTDSRTLFDYCFDNFQLFNVSENETKYTSSDGVSTGSLNGNLPFVEMDPEADIVLPKTAEFSDAKSVVSYHDEVSNIAGTISYTYAGHDVGSADIVTTGVEIQGFLFDNLEENETEGTEEMEEEGSTRKIKPITIVLILLGILLLAVLGFVLKYVYDNMYIIRHNRMVRKREREKFKQKRMSRLKRRRRR